MAYEIISLSGNAKDITGHIFGRLTAIAPVERRNRTIMWLCICECGSEAIVISTLLRSAQTRSCGCLQKEKVIEHNRTHSMSGHLLYARWSSMKDRCYNESNKYFPYYGGRGIHVCKRWKHSFSNFFADMGECPNQMTLDRIDNDGDYCPENCQWATARQQANNTRHNRFITCNGETKTIAQWCRKLGGRCDLVYSRLKRGWSEERAVTQPLRQKKVTKKD